MGNSRIAAFVRSYDGKLAIASLVAIGLYFGLGATSLPSWLVNIPLWIVVAVGGVPLCWRIVKSLIAREPGVDILAALAIISSAVMQEWLVAGIIVLMMSGGEALEEAATSRASAVLDALAKRAPTIAHRIPSGGGAPIDIEAADVEIGDHLVVLPHELCPVDGEVTEGRGVMDESFLTGEPYSITKSVGSAVLSGAINGDTAITVIAMQRAADSRYAQIVGVLHDAESRRPRMRRIADRLGVWYAALAIVMAIAGWIITKDPQAFLAVMVIATPCPMLIGVPVAIIGAISLAAKSGIIIKDPAILERVSTTKVMMFDKTGTLTYGRPALTYVIAGPGFDRDEVIDLAAALERYSRHPLSQPIIMASEGRSVSQDAEDGMVLPAASGFAAPMPVTSMSAEPGPAEPEPAEPGPAEPGPAEPGPAEPGPATSAPAEFEVTRVSERPGEGLVGEVNGHEVVVTSRAIALERLAAQGESIEEVPERFSGMEAIVLVDGKFAAAFRFRDEPRVDARRFIEHLGPRHGVVKTMLISGDRSSEVHFVAEQVGIANVYAGCSPEEKLEIVRKETAETGTSLFLGDGINDAPAMAAASVGVAFGQNSDITAEAAGAVVLDSSLERLDELLHIGERMRRIALQTAIGGIVLSLIGMVFAMFGLLPPIVGAVLQEVIDLAAILNAARVAVRRGNMADFNGAAKKVTRQTESKSEVPSQ